MNHLFGNYKAHIFAILRMAIGLFFCASGASKLIRPIEYFQVAMAQYQLIPGSLAPVVSLVVPWIELILGSFLAAGLFVDQVAAGLASLTFLFQMVLAQALIRRLPIDECGCFGGGRVHLSLYQSFVLDTILALAIISLVSAESSLALDNVLAGDEAEF